MPYDAVYFDLFGTLVDYLPSAEYARALEAMARALNVQVMMFRESWRDCIYGRDTGVYGNLEEDIRHACAVVDVYPTPEQIRKAIDIRLDLYRRSLEPRDGAVALLTALRQQGTPIGLISNSASEMLELWPETAFAQFIDAPVFSVEVGYLKPERRIYQVACERLNVKPERCLYIGDGSSMELTGALEVGMHAMLICVPYEQESVMKREEAQNWHGPVIRHLTEVQAYL